MSQTDYKVKFISLISRQDQPLYIQAFDLPEDTSDPQNANEFLKYNFLSHMALDIFTSGASLNLREQQQQDKEKTSRAILLFIQEEVTVYGYQSNTGLKIVVGFGARESTIEQNQNQEKEAPKNKILLEDLFLDVHKCYIRAICNPFNYLDGSPQTNEKTLQSPKFDRSIRATVSQWNDI